jgi:hypothetical protein
MAIELRTNVGLVARLGLDLKGQFKDDLSIQLSREFAEKLVADAIAAHQFHALVNNPHTDHFLRATRLEAAYQRDHWGEPQHRGKSAEGWFHLVGHLSGKSLRAAIEGDKEKALHHTISSAAALANWYQAITHDTTGTGAAADADTAPVLKVGPK